MTFYWTARSADRSPLATGVISAADEAEAVIEARRRVGTAWTKVPAARRPRWDGHVTVDLTSPEQPLLYRFRYR